MFESLTLTHGLGAIIGLYFLAAGLGLFCNRAQVGQMFRDLQDQPMLGYLSGVLAFAIGAAMVGVHNDWSTWLSSFVSLVGWITLLEGTLLLAVRNWFLGLFGGWFHSDGFLKIISSATMVGGVLLLWFALG